MILSSRLAEVSRRGVERLCEMQVEAGGFLSNAGPDIDSFEDGARYVTTFATVLVLSATAELEASGLEVMRERAAAFLLKQCSAAGSFNYWPRGSEQARERPYPDDLDVTACALAALYEYRAELVGPELLAAAVKQLTLCEAQVGGPYYTWMVPPDAPKVWRDVDVGVNANIAYFLAGQGVTLPHLTELVEEAIRTGSYATRYYAISPYPVIYFISRFYRGPEVGTMQKYLLDRRDERGWWGNPMDSALAVSALLNSGVAAEEVERAVESLLATQDRGVWPAQAMYVEFDGDGGTRYAGAPALSTAFVLEALGKYAAAQAQPKPRGTTGKAQLADSGLYQVIVGRVQERFDGLEEDLRTQGALALSRQLERDQDRQIVLLAYFWEVSLTPAGSAATREELVVLGMASLYGWISYTIYDDFLDGEGEPAMLSVANVAMRELAHCFSMLLPEDPGAALVTGIMDRIDAANTWEAVHCRGKVERGRFSIEAIPDYGDFRWLAGRSLGHALGPLYLLLARGHALDSMVMRQSLQFFTHYLIARQLNDDAHDWEEDLLRGQVNAVGALLLERNLAGRQGFVRQPLGPLLARMKKQLWEEEIGVVCEHIIRHAGAARRALEENPEIGDATFLISLVSPLERSAHEALEEQTRAKAFIQAYRGKKAGRANNKNP